MNHDEFAFFNQQLAGMLRDGIPLEGALRQLCRSMRGSRTRRELEALGADLANGTPLADALARRRLPPLYAHMLQIGAKGNDLPAVLTLVADYYHKANSIWTRLKGVLVYPALVLALALGLSVFFAIVLVPLSQTIMADMSEMRMEMAPGVRTLQVSAFVPPLTVAAVVVLVLVMAAVPGLRRKLRWRLPPFREACLAQTASAMALLLRGGCTLDDSIGMLEALEGKSRATAELGQWRARLAEGHARFADLALGGSIFPPLFVWLVDSSGEDIARGFEQAADIYYGRAGHRIEMVLYGILPVSILVLGSMVALQVTSVLGSLIQFMRLMSAMGGY